MEHAEAEVKKKIANQILDEEAQFEYCQKMLKEITDKRMAKELAAKEVEDIEVEEDTVHEADYCGDLEDEDIFDSEDL